MNLDKIQKESHKYIIHPEFLDGSTEQLKDKDVQKILNLSFNNDDEIRKVTEDGMINHIKINLNYFNKKYTMKQKKDAFGKKYLEYFAQNIVDGWFPGFICIQKYDTIYFNHILMTKKENENRFGQYKMYKLADYDDYFLFTIDTRKIVEAMIKDMSLDSEENAELTKQLMNNDKYESK